MCDRTSSGRGRISKRRSVGRCGQALEKRSSKKSDGCGGKSRRCARSGSLQKKLRCSSRRGRGEVRLHPSPSGRVLCATHLSSVGGICLRLLLLAGARRPLEQVGAEEETAISGPT